MLNNESIVKAIRKNPAFKNAEIITVEPDRIEVTFIPGTQRTGNELKALSNILFENEIFSFIKSEKVSLFDNEIKRVSAAII